MNLLQWEFDVIPSKVLKEDKAEYIQALVDAREKEDESLFTDFMIQLHGQHLENEIAQYKASTEMVDKGAFAQEMVDKALRGRENGRYFLFMSDNETVTTERIVQQFDLTITTAKRYLRQLVEFGYLESLGGNKNRRYKLNDGEK